MKLPPNIARRAGSSNLYFRRSVPEDVQAILRHRGESAPKEVWRSLRTSELKLAKKRCAKHMADFDELWDRLRQGAPSPDVSPYIPDIFKAEIEIADFAYHRYQRILAREREQHRNDTEEEWAAFVAKEKTRLAATGRRVASDDLELFNLALDTIIREQRWIVPKLHDDGSVTQEYAGLRRMLAEALLDARRVQVETLEYNPSPEPRSQTVLNAKAAAHKAAKPGQSLESLFDAYARVKLDEGVKKQDTLNQDRKVICQFSAFVGVNRSADSIDKADVREFRDLLRDLPVKWTSRNDYVGFSLRQAAAKAKKDGMAPRSVVTISKELSAISAFFKWLVEEGCAQSNPTSGLFPQVQKRKRSKQKRRPSFTIEQLNTIFASPVFTGCVSSPGKEHLMGEFLVNDWRYWLPLCALFTGARLGELAQLHTNDIECFEDVWIVNIVDDDEAEEDEALKKSLKTEASYRFVPLHPKLIELGFLEFVEGVRRMGHRRLFPQIIPNERGHFGAKPSRFWRTYLKRIEIKKPGEERDGYGSHSFRHGFADECRSQGHMDAIIGVLLGHSKGSTTSGYGAKTQGTVKMRADVINSLAFKGLKLDHLLPDRRSRS